MTEYRSVELAARALFRGARILLMGLVTARVCFGANLAESVNFDFSDIQSQPTLFTLELGDNLLSASTGGPLLPGGGSTIGNDAEFIGVIVPAGMAVDAMELIAYQHVSFNNRVFIGYESGSVQLPHSIDDYANGNAPELPNAFFGYLDIGNEVFPSMGPGPFAVWIQETNPNAASYTFNIRVVPEPYIGTYGLILAVGLWRHVRVRRQAIVPRWKYR